LCNSDLSAVEMLHDSAIYKFTIGMNIGIRTANIWSNENSRPCCSVSQ